MSSENPKSPNSSKSAVAIRVEARATVQGPAATTISVEVDRQMLAEEGVAEGKADRAFAVVHDGTDGTRAAAEKELRKSGTHFTEDERVVDSYTTTLADPSSAQEVSVGVDAAGKRVWAKTTPADKPSK